MCHASFPAVHPSARLFSLPRRPPCRSQMESMQWVGDSSTTLGLIFATVGLGCFVGPVVLNHLFPPYPASLRWGVAASYLLFFAGFVSCLELRATYLGSLGMAWSQSNVVPKVAGVALVPSFGLVSERPYNFPIFCSHRRLSC